MPKRFNLPPASHFLQSPKAMFEAEMRRRGMVADETPEGRMPLRKFIAGAWKFVDPVKFLPNWHIDAKADVLTAVSDGEIDKLIILEPPSYAKSKVVSVLWPAWHWGPNDKPSTRWLCVSWGGESDSPAVRDAEFCRELVQSPWYQREWGPVFSMSGTTNAKTYYKNDKHGYRISTGLDGNIPGHRADIIIIDDPTKPPERPGEMTSIADIKRAPDIWESRLRTRALDDGSAVVLVMHRVHDADLAGYFEAQGDWTILRLPALYEKDHKCRVFVGGKLLFEDPRKEDGEPLHAARTKATAEAISRKISQPWTHAAQDQQRPAPIGGGMIHDEWLQSWTLPQSPFPPSLPMVFDDEIIVVDCAFKDGETNSWVVMQHWARRGTSAYLMDQIREHLDMPRTCVALVQFCEAHPKVHAKYVEDKANGPGVVQMLKSYIPGLMTTSQDDEGDLCLKEFCKGSKEGKLSAVAPYFAARNVYIPGREVTWVPDYIHELTTFPQTLFDDQVDATAMGVWKMLAQFAVLVSVSDVINRGERTGPATGVFDQAWGSTPVSGEMAALAYGPQRSPGKKNTGIAGTLGFGGGGGDLHRDAYGS